MGADGFNPHFLYVDERMSSVTIEADALTILSVLLWSVSIGVRCCGGLDESPHFRETVAATLIDARLGSSDGSLRREPVSTWRFIDSRHV